MMGRPVFSLFHPTARVRPYPSFPRGWMDVCEAYFKACDHPEHVEYVIAVHTSRWEEFHNGPLGAPVFPKWGAVRVVRNYGRDCVVDQCNVAAAASDGLVLHGVCDDTYPPKHWDTLLLEGLQYRITEPLVLHCGSGSPRDNELLVCGAITRARYQEVGFILPPQFESMYADDFVTRLHREAGCIIERLDIAFDHRHPALGKGETDEIYALENRPEAYEVGLRALTGSKPDGRSIAFVTPGERFSWAWVSGWNVLIEHVFQRGFRTAWPPYAGYDTNVYRTRGAMHEALLEMDAPLDFILWLDDDNVITPAQFDRLVSDLEARPELDLVAGWTFCGTDTFCGDYRSSVGVFEADGSIRHLGPEALCTGGGLVPIDWTGFPCVLMRGTTLRKAGPNPFDPLMGGPSRFYGEDLSFCSRLQANGGILAVDGEVLVPHFKMRADAPVSVLVTMQQRAAVGPGKR